MHDWTLKKVELDWRTGRATIEVEDMSFAAKVLIAEGVQDLRVPRVNEWGPSVSVNELLAVDPLPSGLNRLRIEMQSGDIIEIVAQQFFLPPS